MRLLRKLAVVSIAIFGAMFYRATSSSTAMAECPGDPGLGANSGAGGGGCQGGGSGAGGGSTSGTATTPTDQDEVT